MRHPTEGVLRRLVDEPAGVTVTDREHVAGCAQCLADLTAARADAGLVDAALAPDVAHDADVAAAWQRLTERAGPSRASAYRKSRSRVFLQRPAAAAVAVALVLTGASAAAANDWLRIFRTEKIVPISVSTDDLVALPDLSAYGDLAVTGGPDIRAVPDAAAAAAASGLDVPQVVRLPRGVRGEPAYQVGKKVVATFTFSAERAAQAAREAGHDLPAVPPGLDGSRVRLEAGPGVAQIWRSSAGAPALLVGRAIAPTAYSSGVPFETVRDYLLTIPGIPDGVAAQLRTFSADGATLPLPVPAEKVVTSSARVGDAPATVLATRDRTLAAVTWVDDGVLTAVVGSLDTDEVLSIARNLR